MRARCGFLLFLLPVGLFAADREVATLLPPYGLRTTVVAASSDRAVLALWTEDRSGLSQPSAMLFDHDGSPRSERSFRLVPPPQTFAIAAAASDGRDFLVAGSIDRRTVGFLRVRENGEVVPLPGRVAASTPRALVFTGGHYVLLHLDENGLVACSVLSGAGEMLRQSVIITSDRLYAGANPLPTMAGDGAGRVFILWRRDGDTIPRWRIVSVTELLSPDFRPVATPTGGGNIGLTDHGVAWNGSEYLLVFTTLRQTYLQRIDSDGKLIQSVLSSQELRPRTVWTGSNWLFPAWTRFDEAALVSFEGNTFSASPFRIDAVGYVHAAVPVNGGAWAAWVRPHPANQLYADVVRADGTRRHVDAEVLTAGSRSLHDVSLASCGDSTFAAAWGERTSAEFGDLGRVRFARFGTDGQQIGPAVTVRENRYAAPAVACNGGHALVVWPDPVPGNSGRQRIVVSVVAGGEASFSPAEIGESNPVIQPLSHPAIIRNGEGFVVAYAHDGRVMLATVDRDGRLAGPPQPLRHPGGNYRDGTPALVANGSDLFAGWLYGTFDPVGQPIIGWVPFYELRAARLGATLAPLAAVTDMEPGTNSTSPLLSHGPPVLAASPHGYLMVFTRERPLAPLPWERALRFARFDRNGALLDPREGVVLAGGSFDLFGDGSLYLRTFAAVAWNGSAYEVAAGDRIHTVQPDGTFSSRRALETDDVAAALAFHGTQPLMLFTRADPNDGSVRLWVTTTTSRGARRRSAQ